MIPPFAFERIVLRRVAQRCPTFPARRVPLTVRGLATVVHPAAHTIPPNHPATVGNLTTFALPSQVRGTEADCTLGEQMVRTWRKDGIFQIQMNSEQAATFKEAYRMSRGFFRLPFDKKATHVDDQSFSGYVASGEELTDGIADYSEIFTVTKDLPPSDPRVQQKWPCHGPCPWPDKMYAAAMDRVMAVLGQSGETILKLTALGLKLVDPNTFTNMTVDGWHHMRILRFPQVNQTNGKGKPGRGIGSHTDYGLLVLASQDDVGGLFVRPSVAGETIRNWEKSAAGHQEDDEKWTYVPPVENVLTVFPGDMMQFLTNDYLPSTPHKVGLNTRERFAFAYFHEPNFSSVIRPLQEYGGDQSKEIHYGAHFTAMCMRNYPERITSKRARAENRMAVFEASRQETSRHSTQGSPNRQVHAAAAV